MRVLLDCDEVLGDFVGAYLRVVDEHAGKRFVAADVTDWNLAKCIKLHPDVQELVNNDIRSEGFCSSIQVIPGAIEGVRRLREVSEVIVVTAPMEGSRSWVGERTEWLGHHFGLKSRDIIYTSQKQLIKGHVLIDDAPGNLKGFAGTAMLWDRPHNREEQSFLRVANWDECIQTIKLLDGDFEISIA